MLRLTHREKSVMKFQSAIIYSYNFTIYPYPIKKVISVIFRMEGTYIEKGHRKDL